VDNLETKNNKNATNTWYLDSSAIKHVSRNNSSFIRLENSIKF
jgi:hypothetical protein